MPSALLKSALLQNTTDIKRRVLMGERDEQAFISPLDVKTWGRNDQFTSTLSVEEKQALVSHVDIAYYDHKNILDIYEALILSGHSFPRGQTHDNLFYIAATEYDSSTPHRVLHLIQAAVKAGVYDEDYLGARENHLLGLTLQVAASNGQLQAISALSRIFPCQKDKLIHNLSVFSGTHALALTALSGHRDCLKFLLSIMPEEDWIKTAINEPFPDRTNLLQMSSVMGFSVADILLERGFNPNFFQHTPYGRMPFISKIICCNASNEILRIALAKGADAHCLDENGMTPLHWACKMDNLEAFTLLLQAGACLNVMDNEKNAPMHYAGKNITHFCRSNLERETLTETTHKIAPQEARARRL